LIDAIAAREDGKKKVLAGVPPASTF